VELFRRLLAGRLDPATYREVEAHVEGCRACRDRLGRLTDGTDHGPVTVDRPEGAPPPSVPLVRGPGGWPEVSGYRIEAELGRGGMGVVYRAWQEVPPRRVALKMIRAGTDASPEELARFRNEAAAVARLQHPHVVQIFEVGDHEGLPYFSLELVEGGNLSGRLDGTPQPAGPAARLVETLARAVHVVHQRGVIHRDLKPANILLASGGRQPPGGAAPPGGSRPPLADLNPKITDFGLAKHLDTPTALTRSGAVLGTPPYMAPEQAMARTDQIGPAIDVYALGAVLYELLTGRPPFRGENDMDTLLQVMSQEPVAPRQLQPKVPPDLETVCLKCLEKEPARRYASAEALADDLQRFEEGKPILARPVGRAGRVWRWAKRSPALAVTGSLAAVAVVTAAVIASIFAVNKMEDADRLKKERDRARTAEGQAVRRFRHLHQMAAEFFAAHDLLVNLAGSTPARRSLVETGLKYLDQLRPEAGDDPEFLFDQAEGYIKIGDVQGNPNIANLGDTAGALKSYRRGLGILRGLAKTHPDNFNVQSDRTILHQRIGDVQAAQGRLREALASYRESLRLAEAVVRADPGSRTAPHNLCVSCERLGTLRARLGRDGEALALYRRSIRVAEAAIKKDRKNAAAWQVLAIGHSRVGDFWVSRGKIDRAQEEFEKALAINRDLARRQPKNMQYQHGLAVSHERVGDVLMKRAGPARALASYRASLEIARALARADPANVHAQRQLVVAYHKFAGVQTRTEAALETCRSALEIARTLARIDPGNTLFRHDLAGCHEKVGDTLAALGQTADAEASYHDGLRVVEALAREVGPGNAQVRRVQMILFGKIGDLQLAGRRLPQALASCCRSLEIAQSLARPDMNNAQAQRDLLVACQKVAEVQATLGQRKEALDHHQQALAIATRLWRLDPNNAEARACLANSHDTVGDQQAALKQPEQALASYQASLAIRTALARDFPRETRYQVVLGISSWKIGDLQREAGRGKEALASYGASLKCARTWADSNPHNAEANHAVCFVLDRIASLQAALGQTDHALSSYRARIQAAADHIKVNPSNVTAHRDQAFAHDRMGALYNKTGQLDRALVSYRQALEIRQALARDHPKNAQVRRDLWVSASKMGWIHGEIGNDVRRPVPERIRCWREARTWWQRGLKTLEALRKDGLLVGPDARAPISFAAAIKECEEALAKLEKQPPARQKQGEGGEGERR
jgi:tetratricopeptide (TPR) repeat protein